MPAPSRIPVRILHVGKYYAPHYGGIERVVEDLVGYLRGTALEAHVACFASGEEPIDGEERPDVFRFRPDFTIRSAPVSFALLAWLFARRRHYDLVHLHLPNPWAMLGVFFLPTSCRLVVHWHSVIEKQRVLKHLVAPFTRYVLGRCDAVVTTSPIVAARTRELQAFADKVRVVPIGIDDPTVQVVGTADEEYVRTLTGSRRFVFSLGRHVHYKGFDRLIDAARYLPDDVCVVIGGSGPLSDLLADRVRRSGLVGKVLLPGALPPALSHAFMRACDVFVLPSHSRLEAFGIVQVEAMAFERPIVSCRIDGSGVSWVNQDGESGIVVDPGDAEALAAGIRVVLGDPVLARRLGQGGRRRFEELFTKDGMQKGIMEVYRMTLGLPGQAVRPGLRLVKGTRTATAYPEVSEAAVAFVGSTGGLG